ncbi:MAG: prolyl oligopeptidase family serine peptidase [bacterium]|nr:prolyl oligopeptidase family serine peptidase [bacterium]
MLSKGPESAWRRLAPSTGNTRHVSTATRRWSGAGHSPDALRHLAFTPSLDERSVGVTNSTVTSIPPSNVQAHNSQSLSPASLRLAGKHLLYTKQHLRRPGVPARLLYFPDENHWVLKPANSIQWHNEVMGWINRWTC